MRERREASIPQVVTLKIHGQAVTMFFPDPGMFCDCYPPDAGGLPNHSVHICEACPFKAPGVDQLVPGDPGATEILNK